MTGGRPLGMVFDWSGNLLVADVVKGLLSISPGGAVTILATGAGGVPFRFLDDLDVGPDGTIYVSDASTMDGSGCRWPRPVCRRWTGWRAGRFCGR